MASFRPFPNSGAGLAGHSALNQVAAEVLGYINFSSGRPDGAFQRRLNEVFSISPTVVRRARDVFSDLRGHLAELRRTSPTFSDSQQADSVLRLVEESVLPAYRRHHADLLFHLEAEDFEAPFLVARMFESVLQQGGPWDETDRIVSGAVDQLNDFLGYRPLAVLENGRKMEPYPHERFRPVPLYLQGAGIASGRYHDLIERTIRFFEETPPAILNDAYFDLGQMEELAVDVRAHDHMHPVNKRTNYMFGEWDAHQIDTKGRYRRFVVRKIILDALIRWMDSQKEMSREEVLYDGAAVLCGTMLMASSISGWGPGTFDSSVSLSSLLPKVARQRDAFYERLLQTATGARASRLRHHAEQTRQPFGHVRQRLNIELANYGARQVQHRHLATMYARMGFSEAARRQAGLIPSLSVRFETEIQWRLSAIHQRIDRGDLAAGVALSVEIEDLFRRGIECGAFVDPWNILGFQGQFPLFISREDSLPDQRIEVLLELTEAAFGAFARLMNEAAAQGQAAVFESLSARFRRLTDEWDRYATTTVEDLPKVSGSESFESATHVSRALSEWRAAGEAAGAISFWRAHVDEFASAKSYALVVESLLQRNDHVASMGLLMQWLSEAETVGLEGGGTSLHKLLTQWLDLVISSRNSAGDRAGLWVQLRRLFDYLEANAGEYWQVPVTSADGIPANLEESAFAAGGDADEAEDDEDDFEGLFEAAYDQVTWRDTADDGHAGDTLDEHVSSGQDTEFELLARRIEPRLRFLSAVAELWQTAAVTLASSPPIPAGRGARHDSRSKLEYADVIRGWQRRAHQFETDLIRLLDEIRHYELALPSGDFDSNVEFDSQFQTKLFLLHTTIGTIVNFRLAARYLACCLPNGVSPHAAAGAAPDSPPAKRTRNPLNDSLLNVSRAILRGDTSAVERLLPGLVRQLAKKPLLYVSMENGGEPEDVLEARTLQSSMRFLLAQLPALGFLDETWRLLLTAFRMERHSRPDGQAVSEFDRLFRIALRSSLDTICRSVGAWKLPARETRLAAPLPSARRRRQRVASRRAVKGSLSAGPSVGASTRRRNPERAAGLRRAGQSALPNLDERVPFKLWNELELDGGNAQRRMRWRTTTLIRLTRDVVDAFRELWLRHSRTMRLSTVEALLPTPLWNQVKRFIQKYGHDLFASRMLMIGNIRVILHNGIDWFLAHLEESEDPLHPILLLEDLQNGKLREDDVELWLELIYGAIVDKFDRFLEYNTTTTQSDYGEMLHSLLDFLRIEAGYDRNAWEFAPSGVVHEAMTEHRRTAAARVWEYGFEQKTRELADRHLALLSEVEKTYGMRLPALSDHLQERFVKPLTVNSMLSLVPRAVADARHGLTNSEAFRELSEEVDAYLETMSGSGVDVPAWLRALEREVDRALQGLIGKRDGREGELTLPMRRITLRQAERQAAECRKLTQQFLSRNRL